ncbi:MAG: hypothetical protein C0411_23200 [Pseudomonas sp.]|nr:hypothetical protein [Pseudomonas sp.]
MGSGGWRNDDVDCQAVFAGKPRSYRGIRSNVGARLAREGSIRNTTLLWIKFAGVHHRNSCDS